MTDTRTALHARSTFPQLQHLSASWDLVLKPGFKANPAKSLPVVFTLIIGFYTSAGLQMCLAKRERWNSTPLTKVAWVVQPYADVRAQGTPPALHWNRWADSLPATTAVLCGSLAAASQVLIINILYSAVPSCCSRGHSAQLNTSP